MAQFDTDPFMKTESASRSPTLEALYNDLDAFIDELSGQDRNPQDQPHENGYTVSAQWGDLRIN